MSNWGNIRLPSKRLWFLTKYLNLPEATGDPDARLQPFQIEQLNDESQFAIDNKARQVGWSWTAAAGAVADANIEKRSVHIFVSINLDEAREKIRYAKYVIDDQFRAYIFM